MESKQFSKTAAYIAIKFYGLTLTDPYRKLFDKQVIDFYDRLVAQLPAPLNNYHTLLKRNWFRKASIYIDELLLPGDLLHILMRKYYVQLIVERLFEKGYSQALILGAGFDHIGSKYSRKGLSCFELDGAATAHLKQQFLDTSNYSNKHLTVFPANLSRDSLSDVLPGIPSLDSGAKTIVIAEGFFDYLTPERLRVTLKSLDGFFGNSLKLVSTVFSLQELNRFHAFVFRNAVKAVGEQLKLNHSLDDFKRGLNGNNFKIDKKLTAADMRKSLQLPEAFEMALLPGFYLLEAGRSR